MAALAETACTDPTHSAAQTRGPRRGGRLRCARRGDPGKESKPYRRVPAAPRRLEHWLWQVSGLIAGPIMRAVRVAFPDVSSGYDASVNEDAESPLRGSHGLSPCSLFSRPSLNRPGTSSRHMPFASFRSTVTTEGMTVKGAPRVVVPPCVASSGDRFRVTANGRPWRASAGVV